MKGRRVKEAGQDEELEDDCGAEDEDGKSVKRGTISARTTVPMGVKAWLTILTKMITDFAVAESIFFESIKIIIFCNFICNELFFLKVQRR